MQENAAAREALKAALLEAYAKYPQSCSHSVWYAMQKVLPDAPYRTANELLRYLESSKDWHLVPVGELAQRALAGELIVGGLAEQPNGHVIAVFPGLPKPAGGYSYTRNGKSETLRTRGSYALAMSTSLGSWPGARSSGDKTVWDPWANDGKFSNVRFWRYSSVAGDGGR